MNALIAVQALAAATPLVLAGLGELVAERGGVMNVGIEGLMLVGCCAGFAAVACGGGPLGGLLAAMAAGAALAGVFAAVVVALRGDQIVAGMALNLFAVGATGTAYQALQAAGRDQMSGADAAACIRWWGPQAFGLGAATWGAGLAACAVWWWLARTRAGLVVSALGEAPEACAAAGISVAWWRAGAVVAAGAMAGAAGAYLSIMRTRGFSPDMTGGAGFLVLALVIFGRWRVGGLVVGALGFGALDALQQQWQAQGYVSQVPYQAFKMMPYAAALVALALRRPGRVTALAGA
jgi:simple sugar transport system permease protein